MKIKGDFITNSSSSSFVVAIKGKIEIEKEVLDRYPVLKTYIKNLEDFTGGNVITTREELLKSFRIEYGYETEEEILDSDYMKGTFDKAVELLGKGYSIVFKTVENYETSSVTDLDDGDNFIVIGGDY